MKVKATVIIELEDSTIEEKQYKYPDKTRILKAVRDHIESAVGNTNIHDHDLIYDTTVEFIEEVK